MITITYLSTATVPFSPTDLNELLASSRLRNHRDGLTGAMFYAGGHFIQTLEGDEGAVEATYERIGRDPRHRNVYLVLREEIETRAFPDWSMGFETLDADQASNLPGFNDYLEGNPMSEDSVKQLGHAGIFHRVFRDNMR
jgi:hypothetical protein